jgi:hypothetical protein
MSFLQAVSITNQETCVRIFTREWIRGAVVASASDRAPGKASAPDPA